MYRKALVFVLGGVFLLLANPTPALAQTSLALPEPSRTLSFGTTGDDVRELQEYLAQDTELYPEGLVTGYFGPLTQRAVQRFQEKYDVVNAGTPETTGFGVVGPQTRIKIKEVGEEAPLELPQLTRSLSIGLTGDDVRELQEYLAQDEEIYPEGLVTGYFGPLTQRAVQLFQERYGVVSSGTPETTGYGVVGPQTRAKLSDIGQGVIEGLRQQGAGASGIVPPGLLSAPGLTATTTATTTPPEPGLPTAVSTATTTPPEISATATTAPPSTATTIATTTPVIPPPASPPTATPPAPPTPSPTPALPPPSTSTTTATTTISYDFSLNVNDGVSSKSVTQGSSVNFGISSTITSGSYDNSYSITYGASGLPTGATYSFSPSSCVVPCATTLTITTTSAMPVGTYTVTATGTRNDVSRSTTVTVTVTVTAPPPLSSDGCGTYSVTSYQSVFGKSPYPSGKQDIYFVQGDTKVLITADDYALDFSIYPDIVCSGDSFGVAWTEGRADTVPAYFAGLEFKEQLYFMKLDRKGLRLTGEIQLTQAAAKFNNKPSIAWAGTEYGIVWADDRVWRLVNSNIGSSGNWDIYFVRVALDGTKITTEKRITNCSPPKSCAPKDLSWDPAGYYTLTYGDWECCWQETVRSVKLDINGNIVTQTKLPAPTYIRADWGGGWYDIRDHTLGQRITFQYPNDSASKTTTFRLYQKRPSDSSLSLAAEFSGIDSTTCSGTNGGQGKIVGEWALMGAPWTSCPSWSLERVKQGTTYAGTAGAGSFPVSSYAVGEYSFYITAVNSNGEEGLPSLVVKQVFLDPVTILSPTSSQSPVLPTPVFQWTENSGWPSALRYGVAIFDSESSGYGINPFWTKNLTISRGTNSVTYDGPPLDPTKKYKVSVYGQWVDASQNPWIDYELQPQATTEFWISTTSAFQSRESVFASILTSISQILKTLEQLLR